MTTALDFTTDPALTGLTIVAPPSDKRQTWMLSRLVILPDGSTMPVLLYLARLKFETWNGDTHKPYWVDADWTNEMLDNVELIEFKMQSPRTGLLRRSRYGIPSGTTAYHR